MDMEVAFGSVTIGRAFTEYLSEQPVVSQFDSDAMNVPRPWMVTMSPRDARGDGVCHLLVSGLDTGVVYRRVVAHRE